jgi:hypothetical protein
MPAHLKLQGIYIGKPAVAGRRIADGILALRAEVAELADAPALGAGGRKAVGVRVPSSAGTFLDVREYCKIGLF